jgi:hypothetical protein
MSQKIIEPLRRALVAIVCSRLEDPEDMRRTAEFRIQLGRLEHEKRDPQLSDDEHMLVNFMWTAHRMNVKRESYPADLKSAGNTVTWNNTDPRMC